jgi:DNA-binding CsgD family transcriptional regulator
MNTLDYSASVPRMLLNDFSPIIDSIGDRSFAQNVLSLAHQICGASVSSVFRVRCGSSLPIASMSPASLDGSDVAHSLACRYIQGRAWLKDPAFKQASHRAGDGHASLLRTDMARSVEAAFCDTVYGEGVIADRLLIYCKTDDDLIGIGLLRTARAGPFSEEDIRRVEEILHPLLAASRRHLKLTGSGTDVSAALTRLVDIERCIAHAPVGFPRREAQVCARVIYGVSTVGIALELDIAEETVLTYRKRIYARLEISTQRELLLWYLRTWSLWGERSAGEMLIH